MVESTTFMSICPRTHEYIGCNIQGIPIKVIQDKGIELNPHIKFTASELNNGVKELTNNSGKSDSFSIECIFNENDTIQVTKEFFTNEWYTEALNNFDYILDARIGLTDTFELDTYAKLGKDVKIIDVIDFLIRNEKLLYITTRAVGIEDTDLWQISENKSRKQSYDDGYVEWSLTFTKYEIYERAYFENDNVGVTKAINKYKNSLSKKKATAKKQSQAKSKTTVKATLKSKCKASQLVYSKNKKVVTCVKYMQEILVNHGCYKDTSINQIDGWFGKSTKEAVQNFQKKYQKKYKLKINGKVDTNTFNALCSV